MTTVLETKQLCAGYGKTEVVRSLDIEVKAGELVALLGPNGAGKSTTLMTISGALPSLSGEITAFGTRIDGMPSHRVSRMGVALVPEDRGLFRALSVAENLRLAHRKIVKRDDPALQYFPALAKLWHRKVGLLSGGEQQMVALAGALLRGPKILLLDEMSLGLAPRIVAELLALTRRLADESGVSVLLVEQHPALALAHADRAYVLNHGEVVLSGPASEVAAAVEALEASYLGGRT